MRVEVGWGLDVLIGVVSPGRERPLYFEDEKTKGPLVDAQRRINASI